MTEHFDAVVVGSGFASSFFLYEYLKHAAPTSRVLVLEKGAKGRHTYDLADLMVNRTPDKTWVQTIAFGGSSCWTGTTPRPHPSDFEMKTRYGVGDDWPMSYDDLEPYLAEVERVMAIAGADAGPFPRSSPYSTPPHKLNGFDEVLAKKYPDLHIPMPSARASSATAGRAVCCATGICSRCPIKAKFQVNLHMTQLYEDPRVTLRLQSGVDVLDIEGDRVQAVEYTHEGRSHRVACDVAVVGAHGIFSPYILLRSGLREHALGRYLHEQFSVDVQVNLDGVDSLDGSQQVTGLGVMFHDTIDRAKQATFNVESWNVPWLRAERGRWRQRALLKLVFEDLPDEQNYVGISPDDETKPEVYYPRMSSYTKAGIAAAPKLIEELFEGLPVEDYVIVREEHLGSEAHIQGTTRMGNDPETSVVDRNLIHHRVRNLLVLGSGAFPSCLAANPTLPLSALSIWAARKLMAG